MELWGRAGYSLSNGLLVLVNKNMTEVKIPYTTAYRSDNLTPSKYITLKEQALDRHWSPSILNICTVVINVHRPYFIISVLGITDTDRMVKGLAKDASPEASTQERELCNSRHFEIIYL